MNNEKKNISDYDNDKLYWCDYPYIGIGEKPKRKKIATEEDLERIVGG